MGARKKKNVYINKNFCVYFTHLPRSPPWRNLHKILHDGSLARRNQPWPIRNQRWPIHKTPFRRKNLANISYTKRVIANFVPNFVAMATGVGRGKMQLAAFDGPSPKPPYRRKNLLRKPSYSQFLSQISLLWQPGKVRGKIK